MHNIPKTLVGVAMIVSFAAAGCTAEVEDPGEAPDVDVDVSGGRAPDVNITPAEVTVGTDTQRVVTPDIDINPAPQ
jgi:hypothetical protein